MEWEKLDLFDLEPSTFHSQIDEVVLPLFQAAEEKIIEWKKNIDKDFEDAISRARDETEEIDAKGNAAFRETTVGDQVQVIGSACLSFVCTALQDCLDEMASYFNTSHPRSSGGYRGKSWLQKRQQEYLERFGIDFTKGPIDFSRIEELILARNAGLHWDGSCLDEYREKIPAPRFIENGFIFTVNLETLLESTTDARTFVDWVWSELKKFIRKTAHLMTVLRRSLAS